MSDNYNERNNIHVRVMFLSCRTASPSAASIHVLKQSLPRGPLRLQRSIPRHLTLPPDDISILLLLDRSSANRFRDPGISTAVSTDSVHRADRSANGVQHQHSNSAHRRLWTTTPHQRQQLRISLGPDGDPADASLSSRPAAAPLQPRLRGAVRSLCLDRARLGRNHPGQSESPACQQPYRDSRRLVWRSDVAANANHLAICLWAPPPSRICTHAQSRGRAVG